MEQSAISLIEQGITRRIGRRNAITNKAIQAAMKERGYDLSFADVCDAIQELRLKRKLFICGDQSGYYMAETTYEREAWLKSLKARIDKQLLVFTTMNAEHGRRARQAQMEL